jgi:hypothetical protein
MESEGKTIIKPHTSIGVVCRSQEFAKAPSMGQKYKTTKQAGDYTPDSSQEFAKAPHVGQKYDATTCRPPVLPELGGRYPEHALLATRGYISEQCNTTTAYGVTREGNIIQASFFPAKPPGMSHISVFCPFAGKSPFGCEPTVVFTHDKLILFAVALGPHSGHFSEEGVELFIFQANNKELDRLPKPENYTLSSTNTGLVGSPNGGYVVAALNAELASRSYSLSIFSSENKSSGWRTVCVPRKASADGTCQMAFLPFRQSKVISLTGAYLGWVDLWRGIIVCDVLSPQPELQYLEFPDPVPRNEKFQYECDAGFFRDVCGSPDGSIKFVEMEYIEGNDTAKYNFYFKAERWTASSSTCRLFEKSTLKDTFGIQHITTAESNKLNREEFMKMSMGNPRLNPYHDLMYVMARKRRYDTTGRVVSIDIERKTLDGVTETAYSFTETYGACTFSKYLQIPGTHPKHIIFILY